MDIERFESLSSIGVNYWMMEDFNCCFVCFVDEIKDIL